MLFDCNIDIRLFFKAYPRWHVLVNFLRSLQNLSRECTGYPFHGVLFLVGPNTEKGASLGLSLWPETSEVFLQYPLPPFCTPSLLLNSISSVDNGDSYNKEMILSTAPFKQGETTSSNLEICLQYAQADPLPLPEHRFKKILQEILVFLEAEGCEVVYGNIEPFNGDVIKKLNYHALKGKKTIPDNKLLGVRWGNLLTPKHLGKNPSALLDALHQEIAPYEVEELLPGRYFFRLPYDLSTLSDTTFATYQSQVARATELFRKQGVLYMNGRRRAY